MTVIVTGQANGIFFRGSPIAQRIKNLDQPRIVFPHSEETRNSPQSYVDSVSGRDYTFFRGPNFSIFGLGFQKPFPNRMEDFSEKDFERFKLHFRRVFYLTNGFTPQLGFQASRKTEKALFVGSEILHPYLEFRQLMEHEKKLGGKFAHIKVDFDAEIVRPAKIQLVSAGEEAA